MVDVYIITVKKITKRDEYFYNSNSWVTNSFNLVIENLEKKFPQGNFMKIWTGSGNKNSFILFTDVKENCSELFYYINKQKRDRPELIKIQIKPIELELTYKKGINILAHYSATLNWVIDTGIYKFGPSSKEIFYDKKFWCKLAKFYGDFHSRS